jgi:hypothetical protein
MHLVLWIWLWSVSKFGVELTATPFVVGIEVNVSLFLFEANSTAISLGITE